MRTTVPRVVPSIFFMPGIQAKTVWPLGCNSNSNVSCGVEQVDH